MTEAGDILFEARGRAGIVTLNRPDAFNALTLPMAHAMHAQLDQWAVADEIERVVLKAAPGKAFCAGGDIRNLYDWGRAGDPRALRFFHDEYRLNRAIKTYPKPFISLIDGIVMGGGVGLSVHGSHRVATENIVFAMPEVGIGLFPDVGATYVLPRLPGETGAYLALTGNRFRRADCLWSGIATHGTDAARLGELLDALADTDDVDGVLAEFAAAPEPAPHAAARPVADRVFAGDEVAAILHALDSLTGDDAEFGGKTASTVRAKSPTSLKIALRQIRLGATLAFDDCMRVEFRIVSRVLKGHEFYEGVRATIIDKDQAPDWDPATLDAVTDADVARYFAPLGDNELEFKTPCA